MRPGVGLVGRHAVSVGKLPVDLGVKVRKRDTEISVEFPDTRFVWRRARLRGVINKIVSEQFFEDIEVPVTLDFFGIPADDSFGRF
jgi:hypothetical protein